MDYNVYFDCGFFLEQTGRCPKLSEEILDLFRVQASLYLQALQQAEDPADIRYLAHGMRNAACAIGAGRLTTAAAAIERHALETPEATALLRQMRHDCSDLFIDTLSAIENCSFQPQSALRAA